VTVRNGGAKLGAVRNVRMTIEEIGMDGSISLGKCCNKTLKNWVNDINNQLESQKYDWRVTSIMEQGKGAISAISKERYDAIKNIL